MKKAMPYVRLIIKTFWKMGLILIVYILFFTLVVDGTDAGFKFLKVFFFFILLVMFCFPLLIYRLKVRCYKFVCASPRITIECLAQKVSPKDALNQDFKSTIINFLKELVQLGFFPAGARYDETAKMIIFPGVPVPVQSAAAPELSPSDEDYGYCGMCGAKIDKSTRFCTHCGAEISAPDMTE